MTMNRSKNALNELLEDMWSMALLTFDGDLRTMSDVRTRFETLVDFLKTKGVTITDEEQQQYITPIVKDLDWGRENIITGISYCDYVEEQRFGECNERVIEDFDGEGDMQLVYVPQCGLEHRYRGEQYEGQFDEIREDGHQVQVVVAEPDPEKRPWTILDANGQVMSQFKTKEEAEAKMSELSAADGLYTLPLELNHEHPWIPRPDSMKDSPLVAYYHHKTKN